MIDSLPASHLDVLVDRLSRGVELLFDLEQRGELGREYARWLQGWLDLLSEYETLHAA